MRVIMVIVIRPLLNPYGSPNLKSLTGLQDRMAWNPIASAWQYVHARLQSVMPQSVRTVAFGKPSTLMVHSNKLHPVSYAPLYCQRDRSPTRCGGGIHLHRHQAIYVAHLACWTSEASHVPHVGHVESALSIFVCVERIYARWCIDHKPS